jgi:hypothetical protein
LSSGRRSLIPVSGITELGAAAEITVGGGSPMYRQIILDQIADVGTQMTKLAAEHRRAVSASDWALVNELQQTLVEMMKLKGDLLKRLDEH